MRILFPNKIIEKDNKKILPMKLYRGLNLNKSELDFIIANGDNKYEKGGWLLKPTIDFHNLSVNQVLENISNENDDIERYNQETKDVSKLGKYVTSCFEGASIYSNGSYEKELNVVFEIEAPDNKIFIDGRDFLYHIVFQVISHKKNLSEEITNKLKIVFGKKLIEYLEKGKILSERSPNIINRYTDYICMDQTVIKEHYKNDKVIINGKYSTQFFGAFALIGGINSEIIKNNIKALNINRKTPYYQIKKNIDLISLKDFF